MSLVALALAVQAPAAATLTVQEAFDQAAKAIEAGQVDSGVAAYRALEARLVKLNAKSLPLVRLRLGSALLAQGKDAEAAALIRSTVASWTGPDPGAERAVTLLDLAGGAERTLDYPAARRDYAAARDLLPAGAAFNGARLGALGGIARVAMFDDASAAVAAADEALRIAAGDPAIGKALHAQLLTLRGRALLNRGDSPGARAALKLALAELGGLTMRVDRADLAVRSDMAIAALLAGDAEDARKYLAWAGAGTQKDGDLVSAEATLPQCGGEDGLRPDDVAIVQFAIADDGAVASVAPVYASRQGIGLAFARAVGGWSWQADEVKAIKPFFRAFTRLELRCTGSADRPSPVALLDEAVGEWLRAQRVPSYAGEAGGARGLAMARTMLADTSVEAPAALPALLTVAMNPLVPADEATAAAERAWKIAIASEAPGAVRAQIGVVLGGRRIAARSSRGRPGAASLREAYAPLLADSAIAADPRAAAAVRLTLAQPLRRIDREGAAALLRQVADDARLAGDPLRAGALVQLASVEYDAGHTDAARAAFARSGLGEQQCALVDAQPALRSANTAGAFPIAAADWGFEGWVQAEMDVAADGSTANIRPVIAYPPFVFGRAASEILKRARFTQSYRPAGGLGCGGLTQRVRFAL